ncbi:phospho-N-acetylmuramoyl-pentapeptide-transferase [bacterium]
MAYLIYSHFHQYFTPLNVLQYISFRTAGALLTALFLTFLVTLPIIKRLKQFKVHQKIRADGPETHFPKADTPTMGGIIIFICMIISIILWARLDNRFVVIALIGTVYLGLIGFIDDYLKHVKCDPKGLRPRYKLFAQFVLAIALAVYLYLYPSSQEYQAFVNIPYLKSVFINLGVFYILFVIFTIVGASNAVNLTDGLDGLAVGAIIFCSLTYMVLAYVVGHIKFSSYLRIVPIIGSGELVVFLAALVGAGLGFLWYNTYPAEIFMGDTGSLFLGGAIGIIAVIIKQEILLIVAGGIFVIEALSVILQVGFFRFKKKRIFKMAPLHHHFELLGWSEPKIVIRFWILGIILALVALSALKIR